MKNTMKNLRLLLCGLLFGASPTADAEEAKEKTADKIIWERAMKGASTKKEVRPFLSPAKETLDLRDRSINISNLFLDKEVDLRLKPRKDGLVIRGKITF